MSRISFWFTIPRIGISFRASKTIHIPLYKYHFEYRIRTTSNAEHITRKDVQIVFEIPIVFEVIFESYTYSVFEMIFEFHSCSQLYTNDIRILGIRNDSRIMFGARIMCSKWCSNSIHYSKSSAIDFEMMLESYSALTTYSIFEMMFESYQVFRMVFQLCSRRLSKS